MGSIAMPVSRSLLVAFLIAACAATGSEAVAYDANWAAGLSVTYKDGVAADWNEGHHGWDSTADWVQSGPNNAACPVDKDGANERAGSPWQDHTADLTACKYAAAQVGADYISYNPSTSKCRVSMNCKNVNGPPVNGQTVNDVPHAASGWKIYATGLACSVPTLAKYPDATCNVAKCRGDTQANGRVAGDLECGWYPRWVHDNTMGNAMRAQGFNGDGTKKKKNRNKDPSIGASCLDNLSSGESYVKIDDGYGLCVNMLGDDAMMGNPNLVLVTRDDHKGANGVFTKFTTKPVDTRETGSGDKRTGIMVTKRTRCDAGATDTATTVAKPRKCVTFKTGHCFKCPADIWPNSDMSLEYSTAYTKKFVECCVMGKNKNDCPAATRNVGAFTATNHKDAQVKSDFQCTGDDLKKAQMMIGGA